jgi:ankyrin repeat protein
METEPLWYELRNLVFSKEFTRAEALLAANPDLLTVKNSIGETVLHYLAVENDLEGVAWLYAHGFSLNTGTEFGNPMVFEVAVLGHKHLLLWLAQNGTDFSVVDRENRGIMEYLIEGLTEGRDWVHQTPITDGRAEEYWRRREDTARFLAENVPSLSLPDELK